MSDGQGATTDAPQNPSNSLEAGSDSKALEQVHVLTRELGDLQKQFLSFGQEMQKKVDDARSDAQIAIQEATSSLRLELAAKAKETTELKADLSKEMQDLVSNLQQELAELRKESDTKQSAEHSKVNSLEKEVAELRTSQADVNSQIGKVSFSMEELGKQVKAAQEIDKVTVAVDQLSKDVKVAQQELAEHSKNSEAMKAEQAKASEHIMGLLEQSTAQAKALEELAEEHAKALEQHGKSVEEASSALRLELADHGKSAAEMKASTEAAHQALSKAMEDRHIRLAAKQAQASEELAMEHTKALQSINDNVEKFARESEARHDSQKTNIDLHAAAVEKNMEEIHGKLQEGLTQLQSNHDNDLSRLAAEQTKASEGHTKAMEEIATAHRKALEEQAGLQAKALQDHASSHAASLAAMEKSTKENFEKFIRENDARHDLQKTQIDAHAATVEKSMEDMHGKLQQGLTQLQSNHDSDLKDLLGQLNTQVDKVSSLAKALDQTDAAQRQALDEHSAAHAKALAEHADVHSEKLSQHAVTLDKGMEDVHARVTQEVADLRADHSSKLEGVSSKMDSRIEGVEMNLVNFGKNLTAHQDELHASLRSDLEQHSANAEEMKSAFQAAHEDLSKSMKERHERLADKQSKASEIFQAAHEELAKSMHEGHERLDKKQSKASEIFQAAHEELAKSVCESHEKLSAEQAKAAEELKNAAEAQSSAHTRALEEQATAHTKALEEQATAHTKALEEQSSAHAKALEDHASTHATALAELDKSMHGKLVSFNDHHMQNHELLVNKLGDYVKEAADYKAEAVEAHNALSKSMDEGFESMAASHAKALMDHKMAQKEMNDKIMVDVSGQIDTVTLSMVELGNNVKETQEVSDAAFRKDLAEHGKNAADMKAEWDERHMVMSKAMDDGFSKMATDHAEAHEKLSKSLEEKHASQQKALEDHAAVHAKALAEHAETHSARLSDVETSMSAKHTEMKAAWGTMMDGYRKCMDHPFSA